MESDESLTAEATDSRSIPTSFLGFDWFDLCVVLVQGLFFVFALPLDQFLLHPAVKLLSAIGFFGTLFFLGRTRTYWQGVQQVQGIHQYVHLATGLGGIFSGIMVSVFIMLPLTGLGKLVGIDEDWMILIFLPLALFCTFLIPYLANRADEEETELEFIECPSWAFFMGRGFALVTANILLVYVYQLLHDELLDDLLLRSILASFAMTMFYIPIRVQEMFLQTDRIQFRSLIQTTVVLIFCGTAPAWLHVWLF